MPGSPPPPGAVTSSSELGEQLRMPGAAVHAVHEDLGAQLHERAPQIVRGPHRGSAAHDEDRLVSLRGQLGRQRVESVGDAVERGEHTSARGHESGQHRSDSVAHRPGLGTPSSTSSSPLTTARTRGR